MWRNSVVLLRQPSSDIGHEFSAGQSGIWTSLTGNASSTRHPAAERKQSSDCPTASFTSTLSNHRRQSVHWVPLPLMPFSWLWVCTRHTAIWSGRFTFLFCKVTLSRSSILRPVNSKILPSEEISLCLFTCIDHKLEKSQMQQHMVTTPNNIHIFTTVTFHKICVYNKRDVHIVLENIPLC